MRFSILSSFAVLGLLLTSCFGDLNVTPADDEVFLAEDFYGSDEAAYRSGLAAVYANLTLTGPTGPGSSNISGLDAGTSQYGRGLWNLNELTTDEVKWTWENDPGTRELNRNIWNADNVILLGMFGRTMASVAFANEYLRQTTDDRLTERGVSDAVRANIQTYRAEARFLRALSYYHMMDLFGRAPMVTEDDPLGAFQAPEVNRAELFSFVETELLDILDEMIDPMANEYARADRAAAWMVLAKMYLNAEVYIGADRYSDCITMCENILGGGFSLTPEYLFNFMGDNDATEARNEIIFPIVSDGVFTQNYGPTTLMINGQVGSQESNGEDFGIAAGGWGGALRVTGQFSEVFLNGDYDTDDRNTLIVDDRALYINDIAQQTQGYIIQKWSNLTSTGGPGQDQGLVDTDFPMFRLADVHLMYAEAHLRGGGGSLDQATTLFNDLRNRAGNPNTINSGDLTLDLILDERLVELHWESHRRQDLIRYGLFTGGSYNWNWKGNVASGISIPSFRSVFPVPTNSRAANPNLGQNTGY